MPKTLYDKLWEDHAIADRSDGSSLTYVDRHLAHEVSAPQSFETLRSRGRTVRRPETHIALPDHAVSTLGRSSQTGDPMADAQFGCGSCREHAVWSLVDFEMSVVIAPDFGEIFANNSARNGLAALRVPAAEIARLVEAAKRGDLAIDFEAKRIAFGQSGAAPFSHPEPDRLALINGWDEIDMLHDALASDLNNFEQDYAGRRPWMFQG